MVARGRAYPVERGVPYAILSDAFVPLLRDMDPGTLSVLSRGGAEDLLRLFPAYGFPNPLDPGHSATDPGEFKTRLFWTLAEFMKGFSRRTPLLVLLEDVEWADASSLELLHFLARQCAGHPTHFLCTCDEAGRERNPNLIRAQLSLLDLGLAQVLPVEPLSPADVREWVGRTFPADPAILGPFSDALFRWTRGNPFFTEEVLKAIEAPSASILDRGPAAGGDARALPLPSSIREAVREGLRTLSTDARTTAELVAVIGTEASHPLLARVTPLEEARLLDALDELSSRKVLTERLEASTVIYDFRHAIVRETLRQELGLQRLRLLHGVIADAMEAFWGPSAPQHADELAYHFVQAGLDHGADKALGYLVTAGRSALSRHADYEAVAYLRGARERVDATGGWGEYGEGVRLLQDLARALQRLGEYAAALEVLDRASELTAPEGAGEAELARLRGLASFWAQQHEAAFAHFERGLAGAEEGSRERILLLLARSQCRQEVGRGEEAGADAQAALAAADILGDRALLARAHRTLALLHLWTGPPGSLEVHARAAISLTDEGDDRGVAFWAHWALAVHSGMRGGTEGMAREIAAARVLAQELRSPVLELWTDELAVELAYASGRWDEGIYLGEAAIALARALNQRTLLPRLLVWTSLFHEGRGDQERAHALVSEACTLSGMNGPGPYDVHLVVPAYTGLAHYLTGIGDFQGAIEAARKGLDLAEGTGYTLWAVHRLLPILAEACLWAGEIDQAAAVGKRLKVHSEHLGHRLGLAWSDACAALVRWKRGDPAGGAEGMRNAAAALEEIPMIPYAVRIRRQLAGRLAEIGEVEAALTELKCVHDTLSRLGATSELEKARIQFREIGHRPPHRRSGDGIFGLTERELEIACRVGLRRSNKAIGKELGISPRTVSTHLSKIFQKAGVSSRAELGDLMREHGLPQG